MKLLKFNRTYAIYALLLFLLEVIIAIAFTSGFIRHTFGDFLVVILMYCTIKSVLEITPRHLVIVVLIIAFGIEFLQLANLLKHLNLEDSYTAKLILGSTFHISDLIAYALGCITILIVEYKHNFNEYH